MEANTEAQEMLFLLVLGEGVTLADRQVLQRGVQQGQLLQAQDGQLQEVQQALQQGIQQAQVVVGEVLLRADEVQA
jgi:hypothetical protein